MSRWLVLYSSILLYLLSSAKAQTCTMSDSSTAPLTADLTGCAPCSSFDAYGSASTYPPTLDTSQLKVLARISVREPTMLGTACVVGNGSPASTQNDFDLAERLEIESHCMVQEHLGFSRIAIHRHQNLIFAVAMTLGKIFAISTDHHDSRVFRLTGGTNTATYGVGVANYPLIPWQNDVTGYIGNNFVDGVRNTAQFHGIRNILVSHVHHVLWVFDYTTVRAVDIRGNISNSNWGNVFYICGSSTTDTHTQVKTGDCVKNTGAQFISAHNSNVNIQGDNLVQTIAPMAESADGAYLYISTGKHSIGRITLTRNAAATKRSHSLADVVAGVEVTSFLGVCPNSVGQICTQGAFDETAGNLATYTNANYVCTGADNMVSCSNIRGNAFGSDIQNMAVAEDKLYVVAQDAVYMIDVNHSKSSYGMFYRVVSSAVQITTKLKAADWSTLSFYRSNIAVSDSNKTLYISMFTRPSHQCFPEPHVNCYLRILEWHNPATTGNTLQEINVLRDDNARIRYQSEHTKPNYVLQPFYPMGYYTRITGIATTRSKLYLNTVTASLNPDVASRTLVHEIPVRGCWKCPPNMYLPDLLERWKQICVSLGGLLSLTAHLSGNFVCCSPTSPNCTLDVLTSLTFAASNDQSFRRRCQRRTNTAITGAGTTGYQLPCVLEEAYRTLDSGACVPCPAGMVRAPDQPVCVYPPPPPTTECPNLCRAPAGYAVTSSGANLAPCGANTYNNGSAKACTTCPWPQTFTAGTGLTSVAQCACRPGYERVGGVGGVCTACALGSYKNTTGDAACASCDGVLGPASTTLQPASANASACVCKPGYAVVGGACQLTACPAGSVVVLTQSAASCQCAPGFSFVANLPNGSVVCAACGDGLFKDFIGNAACTSCGSNTVSLAPRANRTACACAPDYEPGLQDGPDVPGGSCVPECDAGYEGARGICTICATGKFKPSKGQVCSSCPGARSASPRGNTQSSKCSCPRNTLEIAAADMAVVERLGPLLDDSAESLSATGALLLAANASRPLWRLQIVFPPSGTRSARVTVGGRLVFACARDACRDTTVELQGMRGLFNASSPAAALTSFTLRWRTRREVVLAPNAAGSSAWFPAAAAQAQAWAAAGRLRAGAAVFRARTVFSTAAAACAPCPAGLRCAAHVGAAFGA